ncbi:uncharacterized protein LOC132870362 isoform X1 [Neoarius graeffei]|uniref:uncharacterized protein LOC132870362 isoform X1 n=1 Tax=Neoarius graeffei TaxID=443677 RepID=UPI00298C2DE2|nr:uncharacterized protein LOC132870362 isoform X1 [Neoarius graeffei]
METKTFLVELLTKLLHKAPVNHLLVRNMQCLDPRMMVSKKNQCVEKMKSILHTLAAANQVDVSICDKVLQDFREFLDVAAASSGFVDFDPMSDRVDTLLYENIASRSAWKSLWHMIQILLIMSHGQASVERGFSVNKQVMVENMKAESVIAQRVIADSIRAAGGLEKIITKELQMSASSARQSYLAYLDDQRKENKSKTKASKKRSLANELKELKQKKIRLESDIQQLEKSADELAMKAEATRSIGFVVQSNSLQHSAKEKRASLLALDKDIECKKKKMEE